MGVYVETVLIDCSVWVVDFYELVNVFVRGYAFLYFWLTVREVLARVDRNLFPDHNQVIQASSTAVEPADLRGLVEVADLFLHELLVGF